MRAETSLVVHANEIDTASKLDDLIRRMGRKLKNRFGRSDYSYFDCRPVRRACCFRSAQDAYLVTMGLWEYERI